MKFRLVKNNDLKKIQKLFFSVFKKKISLNFYRWRYSNSQSRSYINRNNKIIFNVGFIEKKLNNRYKKLIISRHSSMVHENFRRKGIYSKFFNDFLSNRFINKKYSACIAWPNENNIKTFKKLNRSKFDCLLSSFQIKDYFFFKNKPLNFKRTPWPRSQDLNGLQSLSFAINILSRRNMIKWRSCVGKKPFLQEFSQLESWDIDFEHDFKFCESIFKN